MNTFHETGMLLPATLNDRHVEGCRVLGLKRSASHRAVVVALVMRNYFTICQEKPASPLSHGQGMTSTSLYFSCLLSHGAWSTVPLSNSVGGPMAPLHRSSELG